MGIEERISNLEIKMKQLENIETKIEKIETGITQKMGAIEERQKQATKYTCQSCKNFYQHYTVDQTRSLNGYTTINGLYVHPINCGHCATPRIKNKAPGDKACNYFEEK